MLCQKYKQGFNKPFYNIGSNVGTGEQNDLHSIRLILQGNFNAGNVFSRFHCTVMRVTCNIRITQTR